MPFPSYLFPRVVQPQPQVPTFPPVTNDLLFQMMNARKWYEQLGVPFQPGGLLDRSPHRVPTNMLNPNEGLLQPAADILQFRRNQGLLGSEGAGAARPGGSGPRIGTPDWVSAYEAQQGLRPGTLRPVERAPVTMERPAPPEPPQMSAKQQGQLDRNTFSAALMRWEKGLGRKLTEAEKTDLATRIDRGLEPTGGAAQKLLEQIRPGARVHFYDDTGKTRIGTATTLGKGGWLLDMGDGAHRILEAHRLLRVTDPK